MLHVPTHSVPARRASEFGCHGLYAGLAYGPDDRPRDRVVADLVFLRHAVHVLRSGHAAVPAGRPSDREGGRSLLHRARRQGAGRRRKSDIALTIRGPRWQRRRLAVSLRRTASAGASLGVLV